MLADIELAVAYAQCAQRHAAAVKAYTEARDRMQAVNAKLPD